MLIDVLMFSEQEYQEALRDYKKAKQAGVVSEDQLKWLSKEETQKVTLSFLGFTNSHDAQEYGAAYPMWRSSGHNLWPLKLVTKMFELARDGNGPTVAKDSGEPETSDQSDPNQRAGWTSGLQGLLKRILPSQPDNLHDEENKPHSAVPLHPPQSRSFELLVHTHTPVHAVLANDSTATFKWTVKTSRGALLTDRVVYATNAYTSHLLPHLSGPQGIVPVRGQVVAIRAHVGYIDEGWEGTGDQQGLSRSGWSGNEGFEYWFPRPHPKAVEMAPPSAPRKPLIILGGARETLRNRGYGMYETDDSVLDPEASAGLRAFLGNVFPGKFPHRDISVVADDDDASKDGVEVEWVSVNFKAIRLLTNIHLLVWYYGIH